MLRSRRHRKSINHGKEPAHPCALAGPYQEYGMHPVFFVFIIVTVLRGCMA
jgi:hypothetical protein